MNTRSKNAGRAKQLKWKMNFTQLSLHLFIISFCILTFSHTAAQEVVINEVMPSNFSILKDEEGNYPDWIELYNKGAEAIDIDGFYLSDEASNLLKYRLPRIIIPSYGYLLIHASGKTPEKALEFWETIINKGDEWKFIVPSREMPSSWRNTGYNDSEWANGFSGFGYGDNDDSTIIPAGSISVYIRKSFHINDPSQISKILLHIDYDDGFVAYINGIEIARANLGKSGVVPSFNETSITYVEPKMVNGEDPESFVVQNPGGLLKSGENILAVQVHNHSAGSSDLTAIPFLSIKSPRWPEKSPVLLPGISENALVANFKLSSAGDSLYFSFPNATLADSIIFEKTLPDISIGRSPDGNNNLIFFDVPTPGKKNSSGFLGSVSDTLEFSLPSGFYSDGTLINITGNNLLDSIFYTTDGSIPDRSSQLYSGPISLSNSISLRARIIKNTFLPGPVSTATYSTSAKPALPSIFISTNPENLWDYNTGIYVKGPNAENNFPYFGANFWLDIEKPVHIEMLEPDMKQAFAINAGLKIYGAFSRGNDMKSLAIYARRSYGYKNIPYKIFPDKDINKFESFILRNSGNDWHGKGSEAGTMMRDLYSSRVSASMNIDRQEGRPTVVYINGQYWGIHNLREKINENFLADNHPVNPSELSILEGDGSVVEGSNLHYHEMIRYLKGNDIKQMNHYDYIKTNMDIENFIEYNIMQIFINNGDWPGNNIKFWKPDTPEGKWRWILYDTDFGWGMWDYNKVYNNTLYFATQTNGPGWPNPPWSTYLLRRLLENETFRIQFINTYADKLNTNFLPAELSPLFNELKSEIGTEINSHISRWEGNYSAYIQSLNIIENFSKNRKLLAQNHIQAYFKIPSKQNINLTINNAEGGSVKLNTLRLQNFPWNGTYYNSIPITLTALPANGYEFKEWTGHINSSSPSLVIDLTQNTSIRANFVPTSGSSTPVIINEINYRSSVLSDSEDWVELYNNSKDNRDISKWILKDADDSHFFHINNNTILPSNGYLVIARNLSAFKSIHPDVNPIVGELPFGLSSKGDIIRLFDEKMNLVDSVKYESDAPWPRNVNGTGLTLSLINPNLDNSLPQSWSGSPVLKGTPGKFNGLSSQVNVEVSSVSGELSLRLYPNPFRENAVLELFNPKTQILKLNVYDLNGRLVLSIFEDQLLQGTHSFSIGGYSLPEGVLLIKMETPEEILNVKGLHIK